MLFNSLDFLLFMVVFFAAWPLLRRRNNTRWLYLVTASFVFYGWWDCRFLFLIVGSGRRKRQATSPFVNFARE